MTDPFGAVGITDGVTPNFGAQQDQYAAQNLSPSDIFNYASTIPSTLGGISLLGSRIPSLAKIPIPGASQLNALLAPINSAKFGVAGTFDVGNYAGDLNIHHPKFKFLFKVKFEGFPGAEVFEYFVHKCDKPKIKMNHQDVNYYNFRTRVLTSVTYDPLQISFLDEIGDSVFEFFKSYMAHVSGTGQGNYGIDKGWGSASSTIPYANGYSMTNNQKIIIEQIFVDLRKGYGPRSNRFTFINPRIETFDFDDLNHEDSTTGSMANMTFTYDAIHSETQAEQTLYSWGDTDLFHGGGTSGPGNGASPNGAKMFGDNSPLIKQPGSSIYSQLQKGSDILSRIPNALGGLVNGVVQSAMTMPLAPSSSGDIISQQTQDTMAASISGQNMLTAGDTQSDVNMSA